MNKQYLRKKKYEVLMIYMTWEERGPDQKYIDFENWKRFYYMRKEKKSRFSYNTHLVYLCGKLSNEKQKLIYNFEQYDIKDLWYAYRNRTKYKKFHVSGNTRGGVFISGKYYNPNDILWIIKYKINGNKIPTNANNKNFNSKLIKKIK